VSWDVDVTSAYRSDLVGLESDANEAIADAILGWLNQGPPRRNPRRMAGTVFYEEVIADRYLAAYTIDDVRQRFLMMWLRNRPGMQLS
jgi:hypothetical protein